MKQPTKPTTKPTAKPPEPIKLPILTNNERTQLELAIATLLLVKLRTVDLKGDITYLTANLAIDGIRYILNQADKATD